MDLLSVTLRVIVRFVIFAFLVLIPMKSRFRYGTAGSLGLVGLLLFITINITYFFLCSGLRLAEYSGFGIVFWIVSTFLIVCVLIRESYGEVLFIVLVALNLYVNTAAIAKVLENGLCPYLPGDLMYSLLSVGILVLCTPFFWFLFLHQYRQVIEFGVSFSFWKYIWMIPALTYLIFYVKFVNDYWRNPFEADAENVMFSILWAVATFVMFSLTLQMLIQTYKGAAAFEQTKLITSQLWAQEAQYKELLVHIEENARMRHDWRHHLLTINGLVEGGGGEELQEYLRKLLPEYAAARETVLCQNHVVNIILNHYAAIAREKGISTDIKADIPDLKGVSETDLCIIFGNLMENAMDACASQETGEASISVRVRLEGRQLVAVFRNTYGNRVVEKSGVYESSKHMGRGMGLFSVRKTVEKYHGYAKVERDGSFFSVYIYLDDEPS